MQAVLLAAGQSSRFFPYNNKHKCLVKIAGESIAVHTVRAVKRSGITDIIFITGDHNDFKDVLGNGKKLGVKIRYVVQKEATGAGDALLLASDLINSDFFLINSKPVDFLQFTENVLSYCLQVDYVLFIVFHQQFEVIVISCCSIHSP